MPKILSILNKMRNRSIRFYIKSMLESIQCYNVNLLQGHIFVHNNSVEAGCVICLSWDMLPMVNWTPSLISNSWIFLNMIWKEIDLKYSIRFEFQFFPIAICLIQTYYVIFSGRKRARMSSGGLSCLDENDDTKLVHFEDENQPMAGGGKISPESVNNDEDILESSSNAATKNGGTNAVQVTITHVQFSGQT